MAMNPAFVAVVLMAVAQLAGAGLTPQYYSPPPPPPSQSSPPPPPPQSSPPPPLPQSSPQPPARSSPPPPPHSNQPPPPRSSPPPPRLSPPPPPRHKSSPPPPPRHKSRSPPPPRHKSSPPPPPRHKSSPPPPPRHKSSPPPPPQYKSSPPPPYKSSPPPPPPYKSSPPPPYKSSPPPPPPYKSSPPPPPPYKSSPPPPSSPTPASPSGPATGFMASGWQDGSATFYGDDSGQGGDFGGACGYSGNDIASLYSTTTAALSTPLFSDGQGCGRCYEIRCFNSKWCNAGSPSIIITGTNLCPPNWNKPNDNGGWCNPPRQHFDMAPPSFKKLADKIAGIVPVQFRRVPCQRSGGVRFCVKGNDYWFVLYVMNMGASGDIGEMAVRMAGGDWVQMTQNWGIAYQAFASLDKSKALAVKISSGSSPQQTIIVGDAMAAYWSIGLCYQGSNNFW